MDLLERIFWAVLLISWCTIYGGYEYLLKRRKYERQELLYLIQKEEKKDAEKKEAEKKNKSSQQQLNQFIQAAQQWNHFFQNAQLQWIDFLQTAQQHLNQFPEGNEKLASRGNNEKKKEVDSTKVVEKYAPTEPSTPHLDTYAAAAALDPHPLTVARSDKNDKV